jgi:hypothetical protein
MEVLKINYRNLHSKHNIDLMYDNSVPVIDFMAENKTLFNKRYENENGWFNDLNCRLTVGAVKKIYDPSNFLISQLVSIQPMKGPAGLIKCLRFRYGAATGNSGDLPQVNLVVESEDFAAVTRSMKLEFPLAKTIPDATTELKHYQNGYFLTKDFSDKYPNTKENMEDEMISYIAERFSDELSKEVLTDLIKNVGTIAAEQEWNNYEDFYVSLVKTSGVIHRKTLRGGANWVVMSPKMMEEIKEDYKYSNLKDRDTNAELFYHGTMNGRWKMYSSKTVIHDNVAMVGYKGESPLDSGYFYNPYIPLAPVEKAPFEEEIRYGVLTRYSKKLTREGSKYYGRINFGG